MSFGRRPLQPQSASVGYLGAPKFSEQRNAEAVNKVPEVSVAAEPSTCLGTAAARTHAVLSKPQAHARIHARAHTYTIVTVLIPSPVNFCLGEAHHYPEFPLNPIGISCSQCLTPFFFHTLPCFLPLLALPKFRKRRGLSVMHMNSSMSHNRATNPHCGAAESLSYMSNKGKLPVSAINSEFFCKTTATLPTPER